MANELPSRDKNGRFISNRRYQAVDKFKKASKIILKPWGIAGRLRNRQEEISTKHIPSSREMRMTRSKISMMESPIQAKWINNGGKGIGKKRHTKSIVKDISRWENNPLEERKVKIVNQDSTRTLRLSNKRIGLYQDYDDYLKWKRKDRRVEFIKNK